MDEQQGRPTPRPIFAVCVANDERDDLSLGRISRVQPDEIAAREGLPRIIDDSGEDDLDPFGRAVVVDITREVEPRLLAVAQA